MDISERLSLSYYKTIAALNEEHKVYVVQHIETGKIYIKKIMSIYNADVYKTIYDSPVSYIPRIFEISRDEEDLTVIEEYISGSTLSDLLDSGKRFSSDETAEIIIKLCDILEQLHGFDPAIIHRDIKPSNVMLTASGEVYLLDLNAAKQESHEKSEDTALLGTKGYAAPEQYGFGLSNPQTDIYALGMLMNTLLLGEFSQSVIVGNEYSKVITRCTELKPSDRYKSVQEVKKSILAAYHPSKASAAYYKDDSLKSFLPPGFRTLNPLKMIIASFVYIMWAWICADLKVKNTTALQLTVTKIGSYITILVFIFILFDYRGIAGKFPLSRSDKAVVKWLGNLVFAGIAAIGFFMLLILVTAII